MTYLKVCTKKLVLIDGKERTLWFRVGTMRITEKGTRFLTLFHQPETDFHVFDMDEQEEELHPDDLPSIEIEL